MKSTAGTLYPHEAAIAGDSTRQAQWGLRREYGLDIDNMTLAGMRNLLAARQGTRDR